MTGYTRILLPLDGSTVSEQAISYVAALAARLSVPVRLLMAVEPDSPAITQSLNSNRRWIDPASTREDRAKEYLSNVALGLADQGIDVDTVVPVWEPVGAIVQEAAQVPETLIAMASHGRSGLARWWMGSVTDKVLHMSDNPVLVLRSRDPAPAAGGNGPDQIVVPLDGSELAEVALPHAIHLATTMNLPVRLLQVTPSEAEYYNYVAAGPGMAPAIPPSSPSASEMVELARQEAQGYLDSVRDRLSDHGVGSVESHLAQGTPADAIVDLATSQPGALVAMTTHGRSGVGRMMLGSVAERVVRQSGCPVLLVRSVQGD